MPERETVRKAKQDLRRGEAPSTAAGEFVREEMHHIREGKHGARSTKQAIAIGLSKARRAGVPLKPPTRGASSRTKKSAARDYARGRKRSKSRARGSSRTRRARSVRRALRREPHRAASHRALSAQAHKAARRRGGRSRRAAARKAARTRKRSR